MNTDRRNRLSILSSFFALVVTLGIASLSFAPAAAATVSPEHWIGSWAASGVPLANEPAVSPLLSGQEEVTFQEFVHLSAGGKSARIVFTNEFGLDPLVLGSTTIRRGTDPESTPVTFGGKEGSRFQRTRCDVQSRPALSQGCFASSHARPLLFIGLGDR